MQNPLELYLEQLAHSLRALPREQREAELREVRHHLESLVVQHIENGESPEEATHSAVRQFGSPAANGKDLRWAWRREQKRNTRQAFRRNLRVVVGTRQGNAVIHWPGVIVLSLTIVAINFFVTVALSYLLTHDFFYLVSSLAFGIPMQMWAIVGVGIKRALQMPPEQLTALD